jgi:hypothetical protein
MKCLGVEMSTKRGCLGMSVEAQILGSLSINAGINNVPKVHRIILAHISCYALVSLIISHFAFCILSPSFISSLQHGIPPTANLQKSHERVLLRTGSWARMAAERGHLNRGTTPSFQAEDEADAESGA